MIYICGLHLGRNYYNLAVQKDRDSIFTTVRTIWKPGFKLCTSNFKNCFRHYSDVKFGLCIIHDSTTEMATYKTRRLKQDLLYSGNSVSETTLTVKCMYDVFKDIIQMCLNLTNIPYICSYTLYIYIYSRILSTLTD